MMRPEARARRDALQLEALQLQNDLWRELIGLARNANSAILWHTPILSDSDCPIACDISPALWQRLKAEGRGPHLYQVGGRTFCRTADLRAWHDRLAAQHGRLGVLKKKNNLHNNAPAGSRAEEDDDQRQTIANGNAIHA